MRVAVKGFETVGAKQCRLGYSDEAVRLYCESEGDGESSEWKNEDTEDGREIVIREEDVKDSVRCVFACTARFGVRFDTPASQHAK